MASSVRYPNTTKSQFQDLSPRFLYRVSSNSSVAYSSPAFVALRKVECASGPSPRNVLQNAFGDTRRTVQARVLGRLQERFVGPSKLRWAKSELPLSAARPDKKRLYEH